MNTPFTILVDIDSILDTRLGTLVSLNPIKAAQIAKSNYKNSNNDDYGDLTEAFLEKYPKRGIEELALSTITDIPLQISGIITDIYKWNKENAVKKDVKIYLNIEPYELSDADIQSVVESLSGELLFDDIPITPVRLDMKTLTPDECREHNVHVVITQEFDKWMADMMEQDIVPNEAYFELTCVAPRTLRHIPKEAIAKLDVEHEDGPFRTLEFYFGSVLELLLVDPSLFRASVLNRDYVKAGEQIASGNDPDLTTLLKQGA